MSELTPEQRVVRARMASHVSWANTPDRSARTAPARNALWNKFLAECDGDEVRTQHRWRAHFLQLAMKSAASRKARAA
ncbi:hypothetical protein [Kribbella deserti]|uniref:Integrase n=1 Tax=Kribbella deserti TaxID=1926257 RepID=A0ABV6QY88_9ACTN